MPIPNYEGIAWDDIWRFNPQASSQWDGFRHFSTEMTDGTRKWYGGTSSDEISKGESDRIGIGHWAQDGIAARGFLIDYVSYAEKKGTYSYGVKLPLGPARLYFSTQHFATPFAYLLRWSRHLKHADIHTLL